MGHDEAQRGIEQMGTTAALMAMALVRRRPRLRVLDLGCGHGELTRRLSTLLPESEVVGVDHSTERIDRARAGAASSAQFVQADIAALPRQGDWDLVFTSSTLQWLPDHEALLPSLLALLRGGGQLVAQLPSNGGGSARAIARRVAASAPFAVVDAGEAPRVLPLWRYLELLHDAGVVSSEGFERTFMVRFATVDELVEWMRVHSLEHCLQRLPPAQHDSFITAVRAQLGEAYGAGPVHYPFTRLFLSCVR